MSVKINRRILCMATALCLLPSLCYGQDVRSAVVAALSSHPTVIGAQAGLDAAEQQKKAEISNYYPDVSMNFTGGRVFQDNATSRGLDVTRGAAYSGFAEAYVALNQKMFDGLERKNKVVAAKSREKSLEYMLMDRQEEITLRTVQSYLDIKRIRKAMAILKEQDQNIKDYEKRIIEMVEQGAADEAELQQAHDVSMLINDAIIDYEGQLLAAQASYMEATGEHPAANMSEPFPFTAYIDNDIQQAISASLSENPSLQSAKMESRAARHDVKAAHGEMYPDVNAELSYLKNDKKDIVGGESRDARAVIKMSWNFSTGGREFNNMRKKKFDHLEAAARRDAIAREITRDIYQAYATYKTFKKKKNLSKERVELNEKLFDAYEVQFEGARINLLGLMKAESQLYNAKLEDNDNIYHLISSQAHVLASMGRLKETILDFKPEGAEH